MELCPYCSEETPVEECYIHCQSPDAVEGEHEADERTFHLEHDGRAVYLDVNCYHCGQSGCVGKFDASQVYWS